MASFRFTARIRPTAPTAPTSRSRRRPPPPSVPQTGSRCLPGSRGSKCASRWRGERGPSIGCRSTELSGSRRGSDPETRSRSSSCERAADRPASRRRTDCPGDARETTLGDARRGARARGPIRLKQVSRPNQAHERAGARSGTMFSNDHRGNARERPASTVRVDTLRRSRGGHKASQPTASRPSRRVRSPLRFPGGRMGTSRGRGPDNVHPARV